MRFFDREQEFEKLREIEELSQTQHINLIVPGSVNTLMNKIFKDKKMLSI
ncbi:hypothetical protein [Phocaeicola sp.]|nr:hypothetical protein [Phocaeicola sp.]